MGKPTGFLEFSRGKVAYRPVAERLKDYKLVQGDWNEDETRRQGARCMVGIDAVIDRFESSPLGMRISYALLVYSLLQWIVFRFFILKGT